MRSTVLWQLGFRFKISEQRINTSLCGRQKIHRRQFETLAYEEYILKHHHTGVIQIIDTTTTAENWRGVRIHTQYDCFVRAACCQQHVVQQSMRQIGFETHCAESRAL